MRNPIVTEDLQEIIAEDLPFEQLGGKAVLITGANGLLAAYMAETLLYLNETRHLEIDVFALVRNWDKATKRFEYYAGRQDLSFITSDVCEPFSLDRKLDLIVHAASHASTKLYDIDPVGTLLPNSLGTIELLRLGVKCNVEDFLYFSSGQVYGELPPEKIPTVESIFGHLDPNTVRGCYGESKRFGETACAAWSHQFNIPMKIVRPFHTYGPGMDLTDGRVFCDFVADAIHGREILIKGDGKAVRAYCYLADATRAFFTVLLRGKNKDAYNVGNENASVSVAELAQRIAGLSSFKNLTVKVEINEPELRRAPGTVSVVVPDTSKLRSLGWAPRYGIEEGFARTINSIQL